MKNPAKFTLICGMTALCCSGCASMKPPTEWFGKSSLPERQVAVEEQAAELADTGKGISGQIKSMGSAMSSAYNKTKNAVTSTFSSKSSEFEDPTSLATMPSNLGPEIWITNGQLYESQGNFAKALDNYTKALELEPNNEAALLSTARLFVRQKQPEMAIEMFNKAIAVTPTAATFNELGLAYQQLGKNPEAEAAFKRAIELDPANSRYRNNLAAMLVEVGRSDEAISELEQVFPTSVANYNVAYLHYSNKNMAAAQQHLQLAMQLDPNLQPAKDLMAKLGGSGTANTAMAAYQTAGNIYRTAEALTSPTVPANSAVYRTGPQNPNGIMAPSSAANYAPGNVSPATASPAMGMPAAGATVPSASMPTYPAR